MQRTCNHGKLPKMLRACNHKKLPKMLRTCITQNGQKCRGPLSPKMAKNANDKYHRNSQKSKDCITEHSQIDAKDRYHKNKQPKYGKGLVSQKMAKNAVVPLPSYKVHMWLTRNTLNASYTLFCYTT